MGDRSVICPTRCPAKPLVRKAENQDETVSFWFGDTAWMVGGYTERLVAKRGGAAKLAALQNRL